MILTNRLFTRREPEKEAKQKVGGHSAWNVAQSNPCFEVWLYAHIFELPPEFASPEICDPWRRFVSDNIPGGFSSQRHPVFIESAIQRAENTYLTTGDAPETGCTQVFQLGKVIFKSCGDKIAEVLSTLK